MEINTFLQRPEVVRKKRKYHKLKVISHDVLKMAYYPYLIVTESGNYQTNIQQAFNQVVKDGYIEVEED